MRAGRPCRWPSCATGSARVPGQLRGYLTVVPESRWLKHADHQRFFLSETTDALRGPRRRPRGDPGRGRRDDACATCWPTPPGSSMASRRTSTADGTVDLVAWRAPVRGSSTPDGAVAEFALDPAVAAAAARTPGRAALGRGAGWVAFAPAGPRRSRRRPGGRLARIGPSPARPARLSQESNDPGR